MDGSIDTTSAQAVLPTPRTSLQNVGEKRDEDEKDRQGNSFEAFGADGFTFLDFLDIINPLQHIPVVATLYRNLTGDEIDPGSRVAGSTLFGGPIGTVAALTNVAVEQSTGQDMGQHVMAMFADEAKDSPGAGDKVQLANAPPPGDIVTAASVNPITTNIEVLEWARRETARSTELAEEARLNVPASSQALSVPEAPVAVAANVEVLNWARQEAALSRSASQNEDAATLDKKKALKQAGRDDRQAALSNTIAMGREQSQLNGATAPLGGWFSETMLVALARYEEGTQLNKNTGQRRVEEMVDISE